MWHPIKHYKTIHHHKMWVMRYCFRCGLYWQGLTHDLSKLAPVEFLAGAKYWQGSCSPNNAQRQAEGCSAAWLHHKGRNRHHLEYWIDYGADGLLLVTPYYNKATQAGLIAHYSAIAKEAKAPIIMYSVASRTGCNIEPATVAYLVKNVENIVGVKEASGNISQVAKIMALTDGEIDLYSGNDDQIVPLLSLGAKGVISVLSNVAPRETHEICEKFFAGDIEGSRELQLKAIPLIDQLFCEVNPIPVKKAMKLMGKDCGPLRMPMTELTPEHEKTLAQAMKDFGITLA